MYYSLIRSLLNLAHFIITAAVRDKWQTTNSAWLPPDKLPKHKAHLHLSLFLSLSLTHTHSQIDRLRSQCASLFCFHRMLCWKDSNLASRLWVSVCVNAFYKRQALCVSCNTITASEWKTTNVLGFVCWRSCRLKIHQSLRVKDHVFTKYLHMKAFSAKKQQKMFELRCFALFIDCSEEDSVFKFSFSGSGNRQILTFLLLFLTMPALQVPTSAREVIKKVFSDGFRRIKINTFNRIFQICFENQIWNYFFEKYQYIKGGTPLQIHVGYLTW